MIALELGELVQRRDESNIEALVRLAYDNYFDAKANLTSTPEVLHASIISSYWEFLLRASAEQGGDSGKGVANDFAEYFLFGPDSAVF